MSDLIGIVVILATGVGGWYVGRVTGYHDGWMDAFRRLRK